MVTQHSTWRFKLHLPAHNTERNRQDKVKCEKVIKNSKRLEDVYLKTVTKFKVKFKLIECIRSTWSWSLLLFFFFWNITHQDLNFLSLLHSCCCFLFFFLFFFLCFFFPIQESGLKQYYQSQQECIFPSVLLTFSVGLVNCLYMYVLSLCITAILSSCSFVPCWLSNSILTSRSRKPSYIIFLD